MAKISEATVRAIRRLHGSGIRSTDIAKRFGLTLTNVESIVHRHSWQWLPDD